MNNQESTEWSGQRVSVIEPKKQPGVKVRKRRSIRHRRKGWYKRSP